MLNKEDTASALALRKRRTSPLSYFKTSLNVIICTLCKKGVNENIHFGLHVKEVLVSTLCPCSFVRVAKQTQKTDTDMSAPRKIGS